MAHHYEGDDLIVRKLQIGPLDNNVYVLECPSTHESVVVDASQDAGAIAEAAEGTTVRTVLMTHGDADHVDALVDLTERLEAPLLAHPGDRYPVAVDRSLEDGDRVSFGDCSGVVLHTPGHTPGSICFHVGRHLIAGDTLFPGGPGNTNDDSERFDQIITAIGDKLFTLPDDVAVYPGHGDDTTIGAEKPHLQEWKERGW